MAEVIFRDLAQQQGLGECFCVDSAAVSGEQVGATVDPEANEELVRHGLPASAHVARRVTRRDYDAFDFILGVDMETCYRLRGVFGGDPLWKVGLLLGYTERPREIEDPWMTGKYAQAYALIQEGCAAFLREWQRDREEMKGDMQD